LEDRQDKPAARRRRRNAKEERDGRGQREERRGDGREEEVLDHVRTEKDSRVDIGRALEGQGDDDEAADPRGRPPRTNGRGRVAPIHRTHGQEIRSAETDQGEGDERVERPGRQRSLRIERRQLVRRAVSGGRDRTGEQDRQGRKERAGAGGPPAHPADIAQAAGTAGLGPGDVLSVPRAAHGPYHRCLVGAARRARRPGSLSVPEQPRPFT